MMRKRIHVSRSPFESNGALVFFPSDITYHGFERPPHQGRAQVRDYQLRDQRVARARATCFSCEALARCDAATRSSRPLPDARRSPGRKE